jgi:metal-responsive CopG/Arc/MetJ family transcriptional regulator
VTDPAPKPHRRTHRPLQITLPPEIVERLDQIAARWGTTRSGAIARLTREAQMPREMR